MGEVARGIGLDSRIGPKFLNAGPGYGGSCFPKDTLAVVSTARAVGLPLTIVETVIDVNDKRKSKMAQKVISAAGGSVEGKTIAILGLAFKPDTDDMRESPAIPIIKDLEKAGAIIRAYDPEAMEEAKHHLPDITYCQGTYECAEGADALCIITEWAKFRALDFSKLKGVLKTPTLVDLRNIYNPDEVRANGFKYTSIGRA